jgi:hypothetical protein
MKTLDVTKSQFVEFVKLQRKERLDWPATFSTNSEREIWPFITRSKTKQPDRHFVHGESKLLDEVAGRYSEFRELRESGGSHISGGRFHIDWDGVWGHFGENGLEKFIQWKPPVIRQEVEAEIKADSTETIVARTEPTSPRLSAWEQAMEGSAAYKRKSNR